MSKKYTIIVIVLLLLQMVCGSSIEVVSDPVGAEIILNHIRTGRYTPDTLRNLPQKELTVSVILDDYSFTERTVTPTEDSITPVSFSQLSGFDTISITGDSVFGILQLPIPPVETPYLVNEIIEDRETVILTAGIHRIEWDGGIAYEPIDTLVEIRIARITTLELPFTHRYGRVNISTVPNSAAILIDSTIWGIGTVGKPLVAGTHELGVELKGYKPHHSSFTLFPGQNYRDTIELIVDPDRDGDGFDDSIDLCPEEFGSYEGCPTIQKAHEFKRVSSYLGRTFRSEPFTLEFAPFSIKRRFALNKSFDHYISLFNDGPAFLNNYSGISLMNKGWVSKGLFIGSIEWDYSVTGLRYEKPWDIPVEVEDGRGDTIQYLRYDDYSNNNPIMNILTLGAQAGVQFTGDMFAIALLSGYQYETITVDGITEEDTLTNEKEYVSEKMVTSSWNTTVRMVVKLKDMPLYPRIYAEMSFTANRDDNVTGWMTSQLGVTIPWWRDRSITTEPKY